MNQHQKMVTFDAAPGRIRAAAMTALVRMGATIIAPDDELIDPPVEAITEPGIWSTGERVTLLLGENGAAWIKSRSRQWLTLFDWFANRRNVNRVERLIREQLKSDIHHGDHGDHGAKNEG
ncbi:MAG: hypothetical protein WC058_10870 [Phycisphaeraceae bacterium]